MSRRPRLRSCTPDSRLPKPGPQSHGRLRPACGMHSDVRVLIAPWSLLISLFTQTHPKSFRPVRHVGTIPSSHYSQSLSHRVLESLEGPRGSPEVVGGQLCVLGCIFVSHEKLFPAFITFSEGLPEAPGKVKSDAPESGGSFPPGYSAGRGARLVSSLAFYINRSSLRPYDLLAAQPPDDGAGGLSWGATTLRSFIKYIAPFPLNPGLCITDPSGTFVPDLTGEVKRVNTFLATFCYFHILVPETEVLPAHTPPMCGW